MTLAVGLHLDNGPFGLKPIKSNHGCGSYEIVCRFAFYDIRFV